MWKKIVKDFKKPFFVVFLVIAFSAKIPTSLRSMFVTNRRRKRCRDSKEYRIRLASDEIN